MTPSRKRLARFGASAALAVVIAGAAYYYFHRPAATTETAATTPAAAPTRTRTRAPATPTTPPDAVTPTSAQSDKVLRLVGDARRLATAGDFTGADAALTQADGVVPGLPEPAAARAEIARMRTPEGQVALYLQRARLAVEHDDKDAAEKALAEAERLSPQSPEVKALRETFKAGQEKEQTRNSRIAELLTKMREAIARRDLATADGALNAAERLDVDDPAITQARTELARAHDAGPKVDPATPPPTTTPATSAPSTSAPSTGTPKP